MKFLRKVTVAFLLVGCLGMLGLPVRASTTMEHEGLQVSIQMDKEQYDEGEPITATITVTNTNSYSVTIVNLEQLIPEGCVLAEGSDVAKQNVDIAAGETITLQVTYVGDPASTGTEDAGEMSFFDKLLYGETWGIPNLLLAVIAAIAFGIFMLLT